MNELFKELNKTLIENNVPEIVIILILKRMGLQNGKLNG